MYNVQWHDQRQVGFDEMGRPVIYACFTQASAIKTTVEDNIAHITYLIENAKRTMKEGITTWVFVMDCTGLPYLIVHVISNLSTFGVHLNAH